MGSDFSWSLITGKIKNGNRGKPFAVDTYFGRLLNGTVLKETKFVKEFQFFYILLARS